MTRDLLYILAIIVAVALIGPALNFLLNRLRKQVEKRREEKWIKEHGNLIEWKKVSGRKFEKIAAAIFRKSGYKAEVVGKSGDEGIDIELKKDGERYFAQCKRMEKVEPDKVRSFWGAIESYVRKGKIKKGFFVTTGEFSKSEEEFVKDKPIELINGLELEKMYKSVKGDL